MWRYTYKVLLSKKIKCVYQHPIFGKKEEKFTQVIFLCINICVSPGQLWKDKFQNT